MTLACGALGWGSAPFAAISPDGNWLAIGSAAARIEVQRWSDGSKLPVSNGDLGVQALAFSGDSSLIAASAGDRLAVWRISDGAEVRTLPGLAGAQGVALSADGSVIAAAIGQSVLAWTAADAGNIRTLVSGRTIASVAVSPDGSRVVATSALPPVYPLDGTGFVSGWNPADGTKVWELPTTEGITNAVPGFYVPPGRVVFSSDSTMVARGSLDINPVIDWIRASDGTQLGTFDEADQPWAFTPQNDRLAMTFGDALYLQDLSVFFLPAQPLLAGNGAPPLAVGVAPDGVVRSVRRTGDTFELFEGATRVRTLAANGSETVVDHVYISGDGRRVALDANGFPHNIGRLWDLAGPTVVETYGGSGPMALTPDGNIWVRASGDVIHSGVVPDVLSSIATNGGSISAIAVSKSGQLLALGSQLNGIELRAAPTLVRLRVLQFDGPGPTSGDGITALAFSPDESLLAVADSTSRSISLWSVSNYTRVGAFGSVLSSFADVAFTGDGQHLIALEEGGPLQVFDVAALGTGSNTGLITGASGMAIEGDVVYVAASDGVLRFALPDLTPLSTLGGHVAPVRSVAVSADGKRVVSGSSDGTARIHCLP